MTDRKVLALASPALRRDVACPTLFRQAKRVNRHRMSQKTIERLIGEGLLRWGNASRTFVVLTERGRALNGDWIFAPSPHSLGSSQSEEPEEMNESLGAPTAIAIAAIDAGVRRLTPQN